MQPTDEITIDAFAPTPKKNLKIWGQIDYKETLVGFTYPVKDEFGNVITKGSKDPYDPAIHESPSLAIDLYIAPLPEVNISNSRILEYNVTKGSLQWEKETLPSLMKLGVTDKKQINQVWACIEIIESKKTYVNSSGETKPKLSWVFLALFADEDSCRANYLAVNGGQPSNVQVSSNAPVQTPEEQEKATAYQFLKVIVPNAARGKEFEEAKAAVADALAKFPMVATHYPVDSPEVLNLIIITTTAFPL